MVEDLLQYINAPSLITTDFEATIESRPRFALPLLARGAVVTMPPPAWKAAIEMEHQLSRDFIRTATPRRHVKQLLTRDFDRDVPASHIGILRG